MTWFKVDDQLWSHPKFAALSDSAQALWLRAGCYSSEKLTDGLVVGPILRGLLNGKPAAIRELVAAGLWDEVGDGVMFHDWAQYQPSSADVKRSRERSRERMANVRANNRRSLPNPVPDPGLKNDMTNHNQESHQLDAGAKEDEDPINAALADRGITNLHRIREALTPWLDPDVSSGEVLDIAAVVLDRSRGFVKNPEAYIEKAVAASAVEVGRYAAEVQARSPRRVRSAEQE